MVILNLKIFVAFFLENDRGAWRDWRKDTFVHFEPFKHSSWDKGINIQGHFNSNSVTAIVAWEANPERCNDFGLLQSSPNKHSEPCIM
jgi:hypothetical protein